MRPASQTGPFDEPRSSLNSLSVSDGTYDNRGTPANAGNSLPRPFNQLFYLCRGNPPVHQPEYAFVDMLDGYIQVFADSLRAAYDLQEFIAQALRVQIQEPEPPDILVFLTMLLRVWRGSCRRINPSVACDILADDVRFRDTLSIQRLDLLEYISCLKAGKRAFYPGDDAKTAVIYASLADLDIA